MRKYRIDWKNNTEPRIIEADEAKFNGPWVTFWKNGLVALAIPEREVMYITEMGAT